MIRAVIQLDPRVLNGIAARDPLRKCVSNTFLDRREELRWYGIANQVIFENVPPRPAAWTNAELHVRVFAAACVDRILHFAVRSLGDAFEVNHARTA